ncbi:hypothetical protein [Streptomyces sp. NPDC006638]|uniref:hypothetical protein n=1 Tax=Streptomyces sp. NPDC006638 TaxID=3157183 RepID=UPI0033A716B0
MAVDPVWINGLAYDGAELRRVQALSVMTNGVSLGGRAGVIPGSGSLAVSLAGSTINVAAGNAWVYATGQGLYGVSLNAGGSATLTAAHATLARVDLVYLRVWDNAVDASGLNKADVVYLAGTPSASPVAPVPAGTQIYLSLATIAVPPSGGGAPSVSQAVRPVTVAAGGILPDAAAVGYYVGQYRDNGTGLQRWDGAAWRAVGLHTTTVVSDQIGGPTSYVTGTPTDFTAGQWAPITTTVPPSGQIAISIGNALNNTNTSTSTAWCGWRAAGALTETMTEKNSVSIAGTRNYSTRRVIRSGLTPGASITITPQYNVSSSGTVGSVTRILDGQLSVEPLASV